MSFMHIDITRSHKLPLDVARQKAEQVAINLRSSESLDLKSLRSAWTGDCLKFQVEEGIAKGVKGHLQVTPAVITVHIELTIVALGAKAVVAQRVDQYLREAGIA